MHTPLLASFGAYEITRDRFIETMNDLHHTPASTLVSP
jgi:Leu/Phe-tRNA-protein transferase